MRLAFALSTIWLLFSGCDALFKPKEVTLARVGDKQLLLSEVKPFIPKGYATEDSALFVKEHINKWVEQELLLAVAELNLTDEQKNIEQQIDDYRKSLLIYAYEKEFIDQKLDTNINDEEIEAYYKNNLQNFELKDYVVRVLYAKLEKNAPQLAEFRQMMKGALNDNMRYELEDYCRQFASNYMMEDQIWLFFEDLLKEIPIKTYNIDEFLKNNSFVELEDERYIYFLVIKDYRLKNSVSPLELEKQRIKSILLNKRKLELVKQMRKELYQQALANNQLEFYN